MNAVPREAIVIEKEVETAREELEDLEQRPAPFAAAHQRLDELRIAAEASRVDSTVAFSVPDWCGKLKRDPGYVLDAVAGALAHLAVLERLGPTTASGGPVGLEQLTVAALAPADPWKLRPVDPARATELRSQLEALESELAERQRGPGRPRTYRVINGSIGFGQAGGGCRQLGPGAEIDLDDWQAKRYLAKGMLEPMVAEAATA